MKICAIHLTGKFVFIFREHKLPDSDFASLVPMAKFERNKATATVLGQATMNAINSPGILRERIDFKKLLTEYTGFKSWGTFANATEHHCLVTIVENLVEVEPTFRNGRSFSVDKDKIVKCELNAESIGAAIFDVFS